MTATDEQELLDGQDAVLTVRRIGRLRAIHDHERDEVARLTRELAAAKRRLKEAGWNLGAAERSLAEKSFVVMRIPPVEPPALPAPKRCRKKGGQ
jgi:hypothetical protein